MSSHSNTRTRRSGCRDIWNAFMCTDARYGAYDIPYCPTTATSLPNAIITWEDAKAIYRRRIASKDHDFFVDAYVCWYIDDYKFDGPRGIWHDSKSALKVLCHFAGKIPKRIHPELRKRAEKIGGIGTHGLTSRNTVGVCAEFHAVNSLLLSGCKWSDIRLTPAIRPRTCAIMPYCDNCLAMFGDLIKD